MRPACSVAARGQEPARPSWSEESVPPACSVAAPRETSFPDHDDDADDDENDDDDDDGDGDNNEQLLNDIIFLSHQFPLILTWSCHGRSRGEKLPNSAFIAFFG